MYIPTRRAGRPDPRRIRYNMLAIHTIAARDLPDLWFQAVYEILDHGRRFKIDQGSFAGQTRLEFDYFVGHIRNPGSTPLLPDIPPQMGIPNPVDEAYVFGGEGYSRSYVEYLMTSHKEENESYTYGERLVKAKLRGGDYFVDQIDWVITEYKDGGNRNNQMILQVASPTDITMTDPPCLRHIDTRIQYGQLHFMPYFRSWDLWSGLPANLAAIQTLKEYMAAEIGVGDGEMIVSSKGLHLYDYAEKLAKIRCMKHLETPERS